MIPSPWVGIVLALAVFRLVRLLSYDAFPPFAWARSRILGERVATTGTSATRMGLTNEGVDVTVAYRWPILAELVHCVFCLGLWVAGAVYVLWIFWPTGTLYGAAPFALGGASALIAKNWDP